VAGGLRLSVETLQLQPQSGQDISSNHNGPRPTIADVEYAYPVLTGSGFSDPEARRSNEVHCNRLGAVAVLRIRFAITCGGTTRPL
jgi:hypothetical protein